MIHPSFYQPFQPTHGRARRDGDGFTADGTTDIFVNRHIICWGSPFFLRLIMGCNPALH